MKVTSLFLFFAILGLTGCALQDRIIILEERLVAMERQYQELQGRNNELQQQVQGRLETLGKSSEHAEKNLRTQYASVNVNVDTLQQELRALTGRIEQIEYVLNRKVTDSEGDAQKRQERLDEMSLTVAKLEQRLEQIGQYLNFEGGGQSKPAAKASSAESQPPSDQKLYADAKQAYDKGELDKARQGFQQFLKTYPKSDNADNAQFWIGESYFQEKWYEKAILEYQTVIEKYPKGNKIPAALLKQGLAFLKLGDKSNARLILKELSQKYPRTNEGKIAAQKLTEF